MEEVKLDKPVNTYVFAGNWNVFDRWVRKQVDAGVFQIARRLNFRTLERSDGSRIYQIVMPEHIRGMPDGEIVRLWGWGDVWLRDWDYLNDFEAHHATKVTFDIY